MRMGRECCSERVTSLSRQRVLLNETRCIGSVIVDTRRHHHCHSLVSVVRWLRICSACKGFCSVLH